MGGKTSKNTQTPEVPSRRGKPWMHSPEDILDCLSKMPEKTEMCEGQPVMCEGQPVMCEGHTVSFLGSMRCSPKDSAMIDTWKTTISIDTYYKLMKHVKPGSDLLSCLESMFNEKTRLEAKARSEAKTKSETEPDSEDSVIVTGRIPLFPITHASASIQ